MTDWIEDRVKALRQRVEDDRAALERRRLDAHVMSVEIPRVWADLRSALESAVKEFNALVTGQAEWQDHSMPEPIRIEARDRHVAVGMQVAPPGTELHSLTVSVEAERETILCISRTLPGIPESIRFNVDDKGSVYLSIAQTKSTVNVSELTRLILDPLFSYVDVSAV